MAYIQYQNMNLIRYSLFKKKKTSFFGKSHLTEENWFCITAGNIGVLL